MSWIQLIIGALLGFSLAYLLELLKKPNIKIYPNLNKQFDPTNKWLFLNVIVENKKQNKPFISTNITITSAWITFHDFESDGEIKSIRARWSTTSQPIVNGQIDYPNLLVPSRETIPVGEKSEITVILKVDDKNDHNIYAFNNESYAHDSNCWRKPGYCLGKLARYRIKIKILADGHEFTEKFILLNPKQDNSIDSVSLQKDVTNIYE